MGDINELNLSLNGKNGNISGSLRVLLHVAQKGDIPFAKNIWMPKVFNIRLLEAKLPENYLFWAGKFENDKDFQFLTTQQKGNKWMEEYQMIYSHSNKIFLKLFENKDKGKEIGEIKIDFSGLKDQEIIDKICKVGSKGTIHLIYEKNNLGNKKFLNLPSIYETEKYKISDSFTFNIKIIEAKDVPSMDLNGKSDPYIKLYLLGMKPKEKIGEVKTKIRIKTLNPIWNDEFHFPIKSLRTDILHLSLKDYDSFGRDDGISKFDLVINNLNIGEVKDEWIRFIPNKGISKGGLVHLKCQLTAPGKVAYIPDNTFIKKILNIRIIEAKDIKAMNLNGFSDPYCQILFKGDRTSITTSVKKETLSPYWDEFFSLLITNYETDILRIGLLNKNKIKADEEIGYHELEIN